MLPVGRCLLIMKVKCENIDLFARIVHCLAKFEYYSCGCRFLEAEAVLQCEVRITVSPANVLGLLLVSLQHIGDISLVHEHVSEES